MLYVLDTDVLSNMRKPKRHPAMVAWLQRTDPAQVGTTVINLAEIQCGIKRQMPTHPEYAHETQAWMDGLLRDGSTSIWPLTLAAALILARMYETPQLRNFVVPDPNQKKGKSPADLAVAAIAIDQSAVIVSINVRHFEQINECFPLPGIYEPFSARWVVSRGGAPVI